MYFSLCDFPLILPKNKLSLHLILLTRIFSTRGELCALGQVFSLPLSLSPLCPHSSSFSFPPSPPSLPPLWDFDRQSCKVATTDPPFPLFTMTLARKATPRKHRAEIFLNPTVPSSVSLSLWLKGEIIFPFQMTLFLSVKNRWPCYLVRAQPAATTQVTHLTRLCPDQTYAKVKVQSWPWGKFND